MGDYQELFENCRLGKFADIKELVELQSSKAVIHSTGPYNETLMHCAAHNGRVKLLEYLHTLGGDVNAEDDYDRTPLHSAALNGATEAGKLLIELGCDIEKKSSNNMTPLIHAAGNGNLDFTRLLVRKGADINAAASNGNTALHISAMNGAVKVAVYLISVGADISLKNEDEETALDMALNEETYDLMSEAHNEYIDTLTEDTVSDFDDEDVVDMLNGIDRARKLWLRYCNTHEERVSPSDIHLRSISYELRDNPLLSLLTCPITGKIMKNPVIAADGYTYERAAIEQWFSYYNSSPYKGIELATKKVVQNMPVLKTLKILKKGSQSKQRKASIS